jgi:hypothetical protein
MSDVAKRLCADGHIEVSEIFSYHWIGEEMRFVSVHKAPADGRKHAQPAPVTSTKGVSSKSARKPKASKAKPARKAVKSKPARKTPARSPKRK